MGSGCSLTQFLTKILCQYDTNFANKRPSWIKNLIIVSYKWGQGAALLSFKQKFYVNMGQILQIKGRVGLKT